MTVTIVLLVSAALLARGVTESVRIAPQDTYTIEEDR